MEGPIFGGAYVRREICVIKSVGLACGGKEIYHFCFVLLCIRGQVQAPHRAYIRRGDLTEGFLRYDFGGLYLEGLIHGGAYFRNFTIPLQPDVFEQLTSTGSGLFFIFGR